jgi:surface protein
MTVAHGSTFSDPGASATDNHDATVTVTVTGSVDTSAVGDYTLRYNASDAAGNTATEVTRTVHVTDQTAPVITLTGDAEMTVALGSTFSDPGSSATDAVDGSVSVSTSGSVDTSTVGTYTLTYSATDTAGNTAEANRTVSVTDQTAPTLTLNGDNPMTVMQGENVIDPGAVVSDNVDADHTITQTIDTSTEGTFTLTYTAVDAAGNAAASITRTVHVNDTVPIALNDAFTAGENQPLTSKVSNNDTPGADPATWVKLSDPTIGILTWDGNGSFTYTPNPDTYGEDTFTYKITDTEGESNTTTVTITVRQDPFLIKIATADTAVGGAQTFTIPTRSSLLTYDYHVDCTNDGTDEETNLTEDYTCEYDSDGNYTIAIRGDFPAIFFGDSDSATDAELLMEVQHWGSIQWKSFFKAFKGCESAKVIATDAPDLSQVTSMTEAFEGIASFGASSQEWNTSNIQFMSKMFCDVTQIDMNISGWDTGKVEQIGGMFDGATTFNQDIGDWNTSSAHIMSGLFRDAVDFNQSLNKWDTSSVTNMSNMFHGATAFDQNISSWDTGHVTNMYGMFREAYAFDQDIGDWNITSVAIMENMFDGVTLTTSIYDSILIKWSGQSVENNVSFSGGNSKYRDGDGKIGHDKLTGTYGWEIYDGGLEE